jgi:hypothetical protein
MRSIKGDACPTMYLEIEIGELLVVLASFGLGIQEAVRLV